jgi:hypothetical protein
VFRRLLTGVKKFNLEPERGLAYLEEEGFFSHTPQAVARFLFRQERLSKKQIGQNYCRRERFAMPPTVKQLLSVVNPDPEDL